MVYYSNHRILFLLCNSPLTHKILNVTNKSNSTTTEMIKLISFQTLWSHLLGKGKQTQTCCHSQLSFYDTEMVEFYICHGFKLWAYFSGYMLRVDYKTVHI